MMCIEKMMQLEIEKTALDKETDPISKERLSKIREDIEGLKKTEKHLKTQWENEKSLINSIKQKKSQLEKFKE